MVQGIITTNYMDRGDNHVSYKDLWILGCVLATRIMGEEFLSFAWQKNKNS